MVTKRWCAVSAVLAVALLASCAAPPAGKPRSVALIMSGDVVTYGAQGGSDTSVTVVDVDGKPVTEPHGPVELAPGHHTITLACEGTSSLFAVNVAAGEIYRFRARSKPGAKGCTGALARVRSTNP